MLFLAFDTGQVWKAAFVVPSYVYQVVHWNVGQLQLRLPLSSVLPLGDHAVARHQSAYGSWSPLPGCCCQVHIGQTTGDGDIPLS